MVAGIPIAFLRLLLMLVLVHNVPVVITVPNVFVGADATNAHIAVMSLLP